MTKFDPINVVTMDPQRVDPRTRVVLAQLSAPVSRQAVLGQAAFRAVAISDDKGTGARSGEALGWFFNTNVSVPESVMASFIHGAIAQSGFHPQDVDVEGEEDPLEQEENNDA